MTSCVKDPADNSSSGESIGETSEVPVIENVDLAQGASYFYGYGISVEGDDHLEVLTNGANKKVKLETNVGDGDTFPLQFTDWYSKTYTLDVPNNTAVITVDFGFLSLVKSFELTMDYNGSFKGVELFGSTDGYNFTSYYGLANDYNAGKCTYTFDEPVWLKALQFVIYLNHDESIDISNISVIGDKQYQKQLMTEGATYKWFGAPVTNYHQNLATILTDGVMYDGTNATLGGRTSNIIVVDLGEEKNINEVYFDLYSMSDIAVTLPDRFVVDYSLDSKTYENLGESFLMTAAGNASRYFITRNNTVKARYIRIVGSSTTDLVTDEIIINGCEYEVAEPVYNFPTYKELSFTNVAEGRTGKINGTTYPHITDSLYVEDAPLAEGVNELTVTLGKTYDALCGITLMVNKEVSDIKITLDGASVEYEHFVEAVAGRYYYNLYFGNTAGKSVVVTLNAAKGSRCTELLVYNDQPQLPLVRGGFFQLPTSGGGNPSALSSAYGWYLQLKGMRELGMDYVIIQYSAHYEAKTTLINGERIKNAGYTYNDTYGVKDLPLAVLNAAEKLGMKVYLGTIHDSQFNNANDASFVTYEKIVADGKLVIQDINDMYGDHPAFAGYYLSDETCDYWLNQPRGVEAARYVYKEQSDLIRTIAPDKLIMIAPAIWRSGLPSTGGKSMYELIKPETEGGKPIVDIVAAQDCLGREQTLAVTDNAYNSYISYLEQWAINVRKAGAEFWHDAEVFEIIYTSKRYDDIIDSLIIEAPASGAIIVFDIPHYFSIYRMGAFNNQRIYYKELIMRDYAKYYSELQKLYK